MRSEEKVLTPGEFFPQPLEPDAVRSSPLPEQGHHFTESNNRGGGAAQLRRTRVKWGSRSR
jgi:hypothetical protein